MLRLEKLTQPMVPLKELGRHVDTRLAVTAHLVALEARMRRSRCDPSCPRAEL